MNAFNALMTTAARVLLGPTSWVFLCLGVKIMVESKVSAFSYAQNGFRTIRRRHEVNS